MNANKPNPHPRCVLKSGRGGGIKPRGCRYKTDTEGRPLKSTPARAVIDNRNAAYNRSVVLAADKRGTPAAIKNDIVDRTLFGALMQHVEMAVLPQKSTGVGQEQAGTIQRQIAVTFVVNGHAFIAPLLPRNPNHTWYTLDTGAEAACYMPFIDFSHLTGWNFQQARNWLNTHAQTNTSFGVGGQQINTWNIAMTVEVMAKSSPTGKRTDPNTVLVPRGGACVVTIAEANAGINRLIGQTFMRAFQLPTR